MKVVGSQSSVSKTLFCFALSAMLSAFCLPVHAQQAKSIPRIGFLAAGGGDPNTPNPNIIAFRQALRDVGYVEGKNILVEYRYPGGKPDRIPSFVAELVRLNVDVLVIVSLQGVRAAKEATKTIPIVIVTTVDPVETGLV